MPGPYTHLTFADILTGTNELNGMQLNNEAKIALLSNPELCKMGAISPDYPYLDLGIGKDASEHWANAMHHKYGTLTEKNILHEGVEYLRQISDENEKEKCFAWFMGYASHVVADVTCHPVTNLLVGDYHAGNQKPHRISEMHQDVYNFKKRLKHEVTDIGYIKTIIGDGISDEEIAPVKRMWADLLKRTFPKISDEHDIDINGWHSSLVRWLSVASSLSNFIPFSFTKNSGIAYPDSDSVDASYVNNLKTPKGVKSYDDIFEKAAENIRWAWQLIAKGVYENNSDYVDEIKVWNLDTGQEAITKKVLWRR